MNPDTDIICLQIVKGVPKAPGDTESAESELVVLDLLDPDGFSVQSDGWSMALPGIKRNGIWADSQITDGRTLIAAPKENVTETIELAIGLQDLIQRYQLFAKLQRMADDARLFWSDNYQPEPVYLKFKANGARVYQYALIYDISIAESSDPYEIAEAIEVTLVIERESAWRMVVPPGGNPLEYWFWSQGKTRGVDYTYVDLKLGNNTDHFAYGLVDNCMEWENSDYDTFHTQPWIDIDGSKIPGDAPALMYIAYDLVSPPINQLYVSRDTSPRRLYNRVSDVYQYHHNVLIAANATTLGSATIDNCGVYAMDQLVNRYMVAYTIAASATVQDVLYWQADVNQCMIMNMMDGEWALFLRAQQTNGAEGDVTVTIRVQKGNPDYGAIEWTSLPATVPYRPAVVGGCDGEFDIMYMGRVELPGTTNPLSSINGYGTRISTDDDEWFVRVDATNSAGATRALQFLDLWFMRVDEGFCMLDASGTSLHGILASNGGNAVIDNTGYTIHGSPEDIAIRAQATDGGFEGGGKMNSIPLLGSALTLKPGVDNRVVFLSRQIDFTPTEYTYSPGSCNYVNTACNFPVRINIVPRCYGVADL